jgi:hypothetical protein
MKKNVTFKAVLPIGDSNVLQLPVLDLDEAIWYYEENLGFILKEKRKEPPKTAILSRDEVEIGLTENGGDPWQHSCYFQVSDLHALHKELKEKPVLDLSDIKDMHDEHGHYCAFFLRDADGLCYCIGEL